MDKNVSLAPGVPDGIYDAFVLITKIVVENGQARVEISDSHRYYFTYEKGYLLPCHLYIPDAEKYPNWPNPEPGFREENLGERRSFYAINASATGDIEHQDDVPKE